MAKQTNTPPTPTRKGSKPQSAVVSKPASARTWVWIVAAIAVVLLVVLAFIALRGSGATTTATPAGQSVADAIQQPVEGRTMGKADAPVLIEVYEDFQCPHCQEFNAALESTIRNELVKPGIARFAFKHRFVIGPESKLAASATECAADQNRFWEYHDALFAAIAKNQSFVTVERLKSLAGDISLDKAAFEACVDSNKHYEAVVREDLDAGSRGVSATPTVFINGERYLGELKPEALKSAVLAARDAAQQGS